MGVLESVLQFREQEQQKKQADINAIGSSVFNFLALKQQNESGQLENMLKMAQIEKLNTRSPADDLLQLSKVAEAAKTIGNRALFDRTSQSINDLISGTSDQPTVQDYLDPSVASQTPPTRLNMRNSLDQFVGETDPFTGKPTARAMRAENDITLEKNKESKIQEQNIKREVFNKDLASFLALDDQLKRGTGFADRMIKGIITTGKKIDQSTAEGFAAATHGAAVKRLRVQLVRAAGDVGNINIVEQDAAEQIIPNTFDAEGTAKVKRAYLNQIGKAINDNSPDSVKQVLSNFMNEEIYIGPKGDEMNKITIQKERLNSMGFDPDKFEIVEE